MYTKFSKIRHGSAITADVPVGRTYPPLPPIQPTKVESTGATVEPELETEASILFEIKRRMILLCVCADHSCEACLEDLDYIATKIIDYQEIVTQKLLENGFMEIFQHTLERFFKKAVAEADENASSASMYAMLATCETVVNMTDISSEACRKVIQLGLESDIINSLKNSHQNLRETNQNLSSSLCELVEKLIAVLYNVAQVIPKTSVLFGEQRTIKIIQRFRTGTTTSLSCLTLMFLALVIDDKKHFSLNPSDEDFNFLSKELKLSLDDVSHRSEYGHKATEILAAINILVINDANKERMVKSGLLSSYVAFLDTRFVAEEQLLAAQGLRTLAFKCAEEIKNEKFCVNRLELLLKTSEHEGVRSQVNGVLIALGVKQQRPIRESNKTSREGEKKDASITMTFPHLPPIPPSNDVSERSLEHERPMEIAVDEPELEAEMSIMFEIGRRMIRLYLCQNHSCQACLNDFIYIASKIQKYYESVTEKLLETGFMEIFQQVLRQNFKRAVTEADDKSFNAFMFSILATCSIAIFMTDASAEASRKVIQLELHVDIINSLKSVHLDPRHKNQSLSSISCELVDELLSVLYNVVQLNDEAGELYREQGIIDVLQQFRTGTTDSLSCFALMLLTLVISDEKDSILHATEEDFNFLNKELKLSIDNVNHRSDYGYRAVEILAAINKLVVSDVSKSLFLKAGVLSSYVAFLDPQFVAEEQLLAVHGLRTLALKCAKEIKLDKSCVERLELLSKKSEHNQVRSQANAALIVLGLVQENPTRASEQLSKEDKSDCGGLNNQPEIETSYGHLATDDADTNDSGATGEPEVVQMEAYSVSYSASTTAGVYSWTKADVREWLERNTFKHLMKWFDDYDGRLLLEFQYVLEKSPELVAPSFIVAHSVKDFLRLIMALRTLP